MKSATRQVTSAAFTEMCSVNKNINSNVIINISDETDNSNLDNTVDDTVDDTNSEKRENIIQENNDNIDDNLLVINTGETHKINNKTESVI